MAAYIANRLSATLIEQRQLTEAEASYSEVLSKLPKRLVFVRSATRRLRDEAKAGTDRVTLAKAGRYNLDWLMMN